MEDVVLNIEGFKNVDGDPYRVFIGISSKGRSELI